MKKLNTLNKILIALALSFAFLLIFKIINYKSSERYYYISSVSVPEQFPINLFGIWFQTEEEEYAGDFYKDKDRINSFASSWGFSESYEAHEPLFLPKKLFLEYIDFQSEMYFKDTIKLPQEKMVIVFESAKKSGHLKTLNSWSNKKGLEFHVGIANEGNIVFWLLGNEFQEEFFRTQITPKPFPTSISATNQPINNKKEFLSSVFKDFSDSLRTELKMKSINVQFKDSIPRHFKYLRENSSK